MQGLPFRSILHISDVLHHTDTRYASLSCTILRLQTFELGLAPCISTSSGAMDISTTLPSLPPL